MNSLSIFVVALSYFVCVYCQQEFCVNQAGEKHANGELWDEHGYRMGCIVEYDGYNNEVLVHEEVYGCLNKDKELKRHGESWKESGFVWKCHAKAALGFHHEITHCTAEYWDALTMKTEGILVPVGYHMKIMHTPYPNMETKFSCQRFGSGSARMMKEVNKLNFWFL